MYPAIAVAEALPKGFEPIVLGSTVGLEARLARRHGYRFFATAAAPVTGAGLGGKALASLVTATGAIAARRLLRRERVRLVLGFGGYASAPAVLAARSLGIPVVLFEANAVVGTANRLLGRSANHVVLGADAATKACRRPSTVTGVPVRSDVAAAAAPAPRGALRVLVCGGSLGSRFLDDAAAELLASVTAAGVAIEEVCHVGDLRLAGTAYARSGVHARIVGFEEDMARVYARTNVALVAAGATTLAELAAVGLPAIVVPLASAARDHQVANARVFAATTGAVWCRESEWDTRKLAAHVAGLASPAAWSAASRAMKRYARPRAAEAMVAVCLRVLNAADGASRAGEAT